MRKFLTGVLCAMAFLSVSTPSMANNLWIETDANMAPQKLQWLHPSSFKVYTLDEATTRIILLSAPENPDNGVFMLLPLPDGSMREFRVWQTPMLTGQLAQKYPDIKTFTAQAVDDPMVTAKLDLTYYGFSAMIYDGENTSFIDPYDNYRDGFYMVHYKRDETRAYADRMHCEVHDSEDQLPGGEQLQTTATGLPKLAQKTSNGYELRTYRLALSCSHQYAQAATGASSPTIAMVFSKMTTSMNRVNGVYNREFSVQMNFVTNEDTLIWPTATGSINGNDPFSSINSSGSSCLSQNQTTVTARIGAANYDCGHVFTTGGGGISSLGVVCNNSQKAKSVTGLPSPVGDGFDIDYVAHEMGHEFGSRHTFNNNSDGSCGGNASSGYAYEPGSGSTIMAYAGICTPDNIQPHSDDYFHASSLVQIQSKLAGSENSCAVRTSTANKLVSLPAFSASYKIPYKTPFELTTPTAVDSVADTLISYCWEQWNLGGTGSTGDFGKRLKDTYFKGPILRSFSPKAYDTVRVFPKESFMLANILSYVTTNNGMGEKVPDTARYLTFKLTVRNILNGNGCFLFPDDTVHVDAISTGAANGYAGFKVTSQSTTGITYEGGSTQTITWNKVGTDAAPYNVANVNIYMSRDGGYTWPALVGTYPNTGSASIVVPNPAATTGGVRFKVKAVGNIFFNVNSKNIVVTNNPSLPAGVQTAGHDITDRFKVYPVPASTSFSVQAYTAGNYDLDVCNTIGQTVWHGHMTDRADIPVDGWAHGIYYARIRNAVSGITTVKTIVIQ